MDSSRLVGAGLLQAAAAALSVLEVLAPRAGFALPVPPQDGTPGPAVYVVRGYESVPCLLHAVLNPGENHAFCSRAVNHPLVGCRTSCAPEARLAVAGQVVVSAACEEIDVAAQVVFTRGLEDREWEGVSDLRVDVLPRPPPQRGGP